MFKTHLLNIGLSSQQATVYDFLALFGKASAGRVSKQTGIPRTMTYLVLQELIRLDLVERDDKTSVARFSITNPNHINRLVEKKISEMDLARNAFGVIEHPLQRQYAIQSGQPGVRFYTGIEGLKKIYQDINSSGTKEIWLVRSNTKPTEEMLELISDQVKHQIQLGISVRIINSSADIGLGKYINDEKERLTERRIIDEQIFKNPSQLIIYANKIALTTYSEPMITILIEHDDIATTLRSMYQFIWRQSLADTKNYLNKATRVKEVN